ncbi:DUF4238 domain-containing protein [Aliiroseovarius sp.]|uniref:DUF4238 domain-containing protein n=1 Tax=Aliiroseovarius sp. TaxID=1872442 RepID=UPI003BAA413D
MALDHYVSQVHLKQFLRQSDGRLLLATRKSDICEFPTRTMDVCRVEEGSTNDFLTENRVVEDFLKGIEPAYEPCLSRIEGGEVDLNSRQVFAGFLAYIQTYSPTAFRLFEPMVRAVLERTISLLEEEGELTPFKCPEIPDWDGKCLSQLQSEGKLDLEINLRMPQAMATTQLLRITENLASSDVTVLRPKGRMRFLTSDFPSIVLGYRQGKFAQRFLPLSPKLGMVFHTETASEANEVVKHRFVEVGDRKIEAINDEIIKAAENLVFGTHRFPWLKGKVRKMQNFRTENVTESVGPLIVSQQRAVKRTHQSV